MKTKWDLTWKLCFVTGAMALMITLISQAVVMKQARTALELRLGQKAAFINSFYSFLIADALQRKDDVTLLQVVNRLEEDQEITSVIVVDDKGEIRYHADPEKIGAPVDDPLVRKALDSSDGVMTNFENSGGKALALVSPLRVQGRPKPIGAVHIDLTYRMVGQQIARFQRSFQLIGLALISASIGLMMIFVRRWITVPLAQLRTVIGRLNPLMSEASLPEATDEFGLVYSALNEFMTRYRLELQNQQSMARVGAQEEKTLADQILKLLLPEHRVILADKENIIMSDSAAPERAGRRHLLDIISDDRFAKLVASAFQQEGEVVRGSFSVDKQNLQAAVLRFPESISRLIKTIIVLRTLQS